MPYCHVSGYPSESEWVLSCSSPGLGGANLDQLLAVIYRGAVQGLPACFTRTMNPLILRDETFRWDCHEADRALSVDISTERASNGNPIFRFEVYDYQGEQPPPPSPSAPPAHVTIQLIKPRKTLQMGDLQVPYMDYVTLNFGMFAAILPKKHTHSAITHVVELLKGGNEMPAYDWVWHYAGKQEPNGSKTFVVWVCANLSPQEQTRALHQATLLGLLEAGDGGSVLQQAYMKASAADAGLGPQASDPFVNRRKLIDTISRYIP